MKPAIWIGMFAGSTLGSMIPSLWGAGVFSFSSLFLGSVGAIAGILIGYRMTR